MIGKCRKENSCNILEDCIEGVIEDEEHNEKQSPLPDNIVYISWKKTSSTIFLLVQFKQKITRCADFNNRIDIKRVVVQGDRKRNFAYAKYLRLKSTNYFLRRTPVAIDKIKATKPKMHANVMLIQHELSFVIHVFLDVVVSDGNRKASVTNVTVELFLV
ncbi:hypothetical protein TcasGA2_TC005998 [Tribolium castaneum]|uniref:Uncharacterized protein n=2 Tax=Tribolium castaneum TaxID=7070 RepID=D6WUM9_TRICA|nr:hypothetical protein TcasGA2_TC005998 [Tribolium castaneum]